MAASPLSPDNLLQYRYLTGTNFEDAITATASGTQTTAYKLTAQMSVVDTVATTADSVALPKIVVAGIGTAVPGQLGFLCFVQNNGANTLQLFGQTPDTINDVATATGIPVPAGAMVIAWPVALTQSASGTVTGDWFACVVQKVAGLLGTTTNDNAAAGNVG
jgi:hypothetical protein